MVHICIFQNIRKFRRTILRSFFSLFLSIILLCNLLSAWDINQLTIQYLELAKQNNSGLKAQYNIWKAEQEQINSINKLPNPRLNFGYFMENIETAVGPQEYKIGLYQKFPWFGKLSTKRKIQILSAQIQKLKIKQRIENIRLDISNTLHDIYYINKKIEITENNIDLLKQLQSILSAKYLSSTKSYSSIIKVNQEISILEESLLYLQRKQTSFFLTLQAIAESKIVPKNFQNIKNTHTFWKTNSDSLRNLIFLNNTNVKIINLKKNIARLKHKRAGQDFIPDAGIGIDYIFTGNKYKSDGSQVTDSGKNPIVLGLSLEIPLQFQKIFNNIKSLKYQNASVINMEKELHKNLGVRLDKLLISLEDSQSNCYTYSQKIIPATKQSLAIMTSELKVNKIDIYMLIDTQRELLKYELALIKNQTYYAKTTEKIKQLTGSIYYEVIKIK